MIPLVDLELSKSLNEKIKKEVGNVIDSKNFILGERLDLFEREFANYIGVKHAIGVGSGTDALRLALRALGIGRGDKVLTVALTSPFTAIAIVEEGAIPVFCDVDENTWTIDVVDAERKIDKKTKAIIPVHLFGNPCDMKSVLKFAKKNKIRIIEDACQAHGASILGKHIGTFGDAAAFSFYPTKNLGAMGDSGIVVTNNKSIANMLRILRHGGQTKRFWHEYQGINSRLDEIQAVVLSTKLKFLDTWNRRRREMAGIYLDNLSDLPIEFQQVLKGALSVYHLFVIRVKNRERLMEHLSKSGIVSDIYYLYPLYIQNAFKNYSRGRLPVTEKLVKELLALPLYPTLTSRNQDKIIQSIKKFFK